MYDRCVLNAGNVRVFLFLYIFVSEMLLKISTNIESVKLTSI